MAAEAVLVTGARAPVALHWAWALRAAGRPVHLADSLRWPIGRGFAAGYLRHAPPAFDLDGFRRDLLRLCAEHGIGQIVPTCEEVLWLAQIAPDLAAAGVRVLAPPFPVLAQAHDKAAFIALCAGFWPHVPQTWRLSTQADLEGLPDPAGLVLKPVFSRFATRTLLRPSAAQVARLRPTAQAPWVAQAFLPGREICAYAIAVEGEVTALAVYHPLYRAGRGAGIYFQPVDPGPALRFVRAFAQATGWSGQLSFDLIETEAGLAPIECNPRATSGLHLLRAPGALVAALEGGGPLVLPDARGPQCVRLAMWLYGAWGARGRFGAFRADLARAEEALVWGGARVGVAAQLRAVAEIGAIALRRRQGLQAASTADIEWNG
ncbi:hypothetical protein [Pseudorhodobacter sp. MZDSW-24AT]|uniref:hypothetical protein n=1 Tax=Pseudorhodobacter sp. MZDSW-24AT TaxID=2052957 RepID=UPI000C1E2FAB|nr:hypothetical protein [Pseudorhodobacter sp. MZDSW-24AT]PJF07934.1 hypothetical protein CUR21_17135 [Pseudorhodobacter sp. MZDSW-24AT]